MGHKDFVSAVAYIPPGDRYPQGAIVSGSRDTTVIVWDISNATPLQILEGHQYQVSTQLPGGRG